MDSRRKLTFKSLILLLLITRSLLKLFIQTTYSLNIFILWAPTDITSCAPLTGYFPCHWVVPVDFPNTCTMKIVRIYYRIIA